jgi:hypothetical protein
MRNFVYSFVIVCISLSSIPLSAQKSILNDSAERDATDVFSPPPSPPPQKSDNKGHPWLVGFGILGGVVVGAIVAVALCDRILCRAVHPEFYEELDASNP